MIRFRLAALVLTAASLVAPASAREEEKAPEPRVVEIDVAHGAKMSAEVSEPARGGETKPAVVAIHGEGADHTAWKALVAQLVDCGMSVVAIDAKPQSSDGAAAPTWTNCVEDALAAVKWTRGTLLADGKKIVLIGAGAGGNVAVAAARKDSAIRGVLVLGPLPGAGGVDAGVGQWDGRPIALVAGAKSLSLGELKKMATPLAKQPRGETILIDGAAGHGTDLLAASPDAVLEVAQWIHGWLDRPVFDGKFGASNVRQSSGPGHIVASQSSCGVGTGGGGGLSFHGQRAPAGIDGIGVMVDPAPSGSTSAGLSDRARRLTITPGKGKVLSVVVKTERWTGKAWKAEETMELTDCGGFGKDANVAVYSVWLPPRVFGAKPFGSVRVTACFMDGPKFTWKEETDGAFGRAPFRTTDPSSWDTYLLR